ncbi:hypothetical protein SORBI_3005G065200 [Sorghum bicolor]|uniref:Uncharacterized protein n=1 Tax=Sorghum bicolor TaxID=4558 RepID=A0A1B6PQI7_SORBI|nr:hypothetical protein SORBI_3005G065200 [Sorghum bicolor]
MALGASLQDPQPSPPAMPSPSLPFLLVPSPFLCPAPWLKMVPMRSQHRRGMCSLGSL